MSGHDPRVTLAALDLADRQVDRDDYEAPAATEQGSAEELTRGPNKLHVDSPVGNGHNDLG